MVGEIVRGGDDPAENFSQIRKVFHHNDHLGSTSVITNDVGVQPDVSELAFCNPLGGLLSGGVWLRYDYWDENT